MTEAVPKGSPILSVPLEVSLSFATFSGRLVGPMLTSTWGAMDEDADQMLDLLALVTELLVNKQFSPWAAYLCTLPQNLSEYDLPIAMR